MFLEAVVEGQETGEVFGVCDECRPDCAKSVLIPSYMGLTIPFFESVTLLVSTILAVMNWWKVQVLRRF